MGKKIPTQVKTDINTKVFAKADAFGYVTSDKPSSGTFLNTLVDDPDIGGVLKEYMPSARVRTYIKDTILNKYSKQKIDELLQRISPETVVWCTYRVEASVIWSGRWLYLLRSGDKYFIVSSGTVAKWETALKKALVYIVSLPLYKQRGITPSIALLLADISASLTDAGKHHIEQALLLVNVKARFC